jgi:hypothetical protein
MLPEPQQALQLDGFNGGRTSLESQANAKALKDEESYDLAQRNIWRKSSL